MFSISFSDLGFHVDFRDYSSGAGSGSYRSSMSRHRTHSTAVTEDLDSDVFLVRIVDVVLSVLGLFSCVFTGFPLFRTITGTSPCKGDPRFAPNMY